MRWAATALSQAALNSAQVFGSSLIPGLLHRLGRAPDPVDAMDVHRRGDPVAGRLHHRQQLGRDDLVPAFLVGEVVEIGGHAGLVPLGDFRTLELNGRRRVAGDDVGAQLGQRIGGVPGDRGLLPLAAGGGEHLAELGDRGRVRAFGPLMQHVGLGFGQRRSGRKRAGHSSRKRRLDREHCFSPMSKTEPRFIAGPANPLRMSDLFMPSSRGVALCKLDAG